MKYLYQLNCLIHKIDINPLQAQNSNPNKFWIIIKNQVLINPTHEEIIKIRNLTYELKLLQ